MTVASVRARLAERDAAPMVVVHRGSWSAAPENSRAAIRAARGFDMVEIDIRLSADGHPVLLHDPDLARTTGVAARCSDLTLAELTSLTLRAGAGGPNAPMTAESLPDLDAALDAAGPDLLVDLDVKVVADIERVAEIAARRADRGRLMLKLDVARPEDVDGLLGLERRHGVTVIAKTWLAGQGDLALVSALADCGVAAAEIWFSDLALAGQAARIGLPLTTYTLRDVHCAGLSDDLAATDPDAAWGPLLRAGFRAIMTDRAAELRRFLACRG